MFLADQLADHVEHLAEDRLVKPVNIKDQAVLISLQNVVSA
jgi:hypothetical protein